jgi:hypothetical protein
MHAMRGSPVLSLGLATQHLWVINKMSAILQGMSTSSQFHVRMFRLALFVLVLFPKTPAS